MKNVILLLALITLWTSGANGEKLLINNIPPAQSADQPLRIVFGSCMLDYDPELWSSLTRLEPSMLLLLGDNIYMGDPHYGDVAAIRELYRRNFGVGAAAAFLKAIPTFAVWDDHDFGPNNADSTFPLKSASLEAFRAQWPNRPSPAGLEDGIAFRIPTAISDILMTDNRTYRVDGGAEEQRSYFGEAQLAWIESELANSKKPVVIIASGNSLISEGGKKDGLSMVPHERERFFRAVEKSAAEVVVLSGDLHYAQILKGKIGEKVIYEIVSSPLTARLRDKIHGRPEPLRQSLFIDDKNFGFLEIKPKESKFSIAAKIYTRTGREVIRTQIR